ncbi:MAG: hypothetical protein IIA53_05345 [Chloroflexi bacterium]|nr:hypothetical protein [Chloroflexota bacterium]
MRAAVPSQPYQGDLRAAAGYADWPEATPDRGRQRHAMNPPQARSFNVRLPNLRIAFDAQTAREWVVAHQYWAIGAALYAVVLLSAAVILVLGAGAERTAQAEARESIDRLSGISTGAASRAGEIEEQFQAIQEAFPPPDLRETDVFRAMRSLVAETGLDIATTPIELTADVPRQVVGSTEYRVLTFKISVRGDFDDVWAFIQRLDQGEGPYGTLVLSKATFSLSRSSTADLEFKLYMLSEERA